MMGIAAQVGVTAHGWIGQEAVVVLPHANGSVDDFRSHGRRNGAGASMKIVVWWRRQGAQRVTRRTGRNEIATQRGDLVTRLLIDGPVEFGGVRRHVEVPGIFGVGGCGHHHGGGGSGGHCSGSSQSRSLGLVGIRVHIHVHILVLLLDVLVIGVVHIHTLVFATIADVDQLLGGIVFQNFHFLHAQILGFVGGIVVILGRLELVVNRALFQRALAVVFLHQHVFHGMHFSCVFVRVYKNCLKKFWIFLVTFFSVSSCSHRHKDFRVLHRDTKRVFR